jgi:hypothetical protein
MPRYPYRCDGCHAVPLNAAESGVVRKPPRRKKDYGPGLGKGDDLSHTYPVDPEPTTPRKPPALLASWERAAIVCEPAGARWEAAAFVTCFEMPTAGTRVEGSATALGRVAGSPSNLEAVSYRSNDPYRQLSSQTSPRLDQTCQ